LPTCARTGVAVAATHPAPDAFNGDDSNETADGLGGGDPLNGNGDTLTGNDGDDTLRPGAGGRSGVGAEWTII